MLTVQPVNEAVSTTYRHASRRLSAAVLTAALLVACSPSRESTSAPAVEQVEYRVGGLPVVEGPSGLREDAPPPLREATHSDGGAVDSLVLAAVDDVEMFWQQAYPGSFGVPFQPVDELIS